MKVHYKKHFIFFLMVAALFSLNTGDVQAQRRKTSQPWGYGAGVIYNFQTAGFGGEVRLKIPLKGKLFLVPEVSYFPSFNPYHEMYAGGALHYELFAIRSYDFYLLAGGYYNNWINADEFAPGMRKQNNFVAEAGGGLVRNRGCWRPFIENRYDFKWKEDNLRIGIYWYPGSCGKRKRKEKCPAYGTIHHIKNYNQ